MPIIQLAHADNRAELLAIVHQVRLRRLATAENTHRHRDGTRFPVRIIAAADPVDASHMLVTVEDITAERQRRSEAEAIDAERRRIAHEIHDGAVQNLVGLRFKSALWSHLANEASPDMRAALDELLNVLTESIKDLRRAIFALRPLDLELLGFFPALTQWVNDFGGHHQLALRLELFGPQDALPEIYELPLFRIIQEALTNIGQHAHASLVLVRLTVGADGSVVVSVSDNGCGFDPNRIDPVNPSGNFGLRQMRERILDLEGTLDIHTASGQGTELVIVLPASTHEVSYVAD